MAKRLLKFWSTGGDNRMKKILKQYWPISLVAFLASALRLYCLGDNPPGLTWDEASLGYNAYSILKTGRDEYGQFLPLVFKSFGDYKPGLYVYLTVPSIKFFGLTEAAVRLPSALIGIFTPVLLYFFVREIFKSRPMALFSAVVLAFSPWHIHFSRGAWEANVALFLLLLGLYSLSRSLKNGLWFYFAGLSFGLSLLSYQGAKMIVPLILIGWFFFWRKEIWRSVSYHLILAGFLVGVIIMPVVIASLAGGGGRLKVMSLFSYRRPEEEIKRIINDDQGNQWLFRLFHSELLSMGYGFLGRYFNHFSGRFLFFEGDWSNLRHSVGYMGVFYPIEFVFLLAGMALLIKRNLREGKFLWYWLLISPLPAAFSRDSIQAVRSLNMVLPLTIFIAAGLNGGWLWLRNFRQGMRYFAGFFLLLAYGFSLLSYLDLYYFHYPRRSSQDWLYGYKQVINFVERIRRPDQKIVFTQKWGQPYIYWLFYTGYNPAIYQKEAELQENPSGDVGEIAHFDNIDFRPIYWPADRNLPGTIFVGGEYELPLEDIDPSQARFLFEQKFLNGQVAFRVVETIGK